MKALGASEQLQAAGARNGDLIMVGNVDFAYFDESPMAARARLAGLGDERDDSHDDVFPSEMELDEAKALAELDRELADLLDGEGDVLTF